jgi:hypothetical protein
VLSEGDEEHADVLAKKSRQRDARNGYDAILLLEVIGR